MKIFLDTADLSEIKHWHERGIIDGVTTNPTHLAKVGGDPAVRVREICALMPMGRISIQVTETIPNKIYQQALQIAQLGSNVLVKIPCHSDYYALMAALVKKGIKINVTLVFSLMQGLCVAKLGVALISPFVGRLEVTGGCGVELIGQFRKIFDYYSFTTQILAASLRDCQQLEQSIVCGADAITVSAALLEQSVDHALTNKGIKQFDADWKKLLVNRFP